MTGLLEAAKAVLQVHCAECEGAACTDLRVAVAAAEAGAIPVRLCMVQELATAAEEYVEFDLMMGTMADFNAAGDRLRAALNALRDLK